MRVIALIGNTLSNTIDRGFIYCKKHPEYRYVFILAEFWQDFSHIDLLLTKCASLKISLKVLKIGEANFNEYTDVINLSDKYFNYRLDFYNPGKPNLADKKQLHDLCNEFGINTPSIRVFDEEDFVFMKPRLSSGAYAKDSLSYKKIKYTDLISNPQYNKLIHNDYVVQEFLNSSKCILFIFSCDGESIKLIDLCVNEFKTDFNNRVLCVFGDFSKNTFDELSIKYSDIINKTISFINHFGYNKIVGTFNIQFTDVNGKLLLHDFNTRTGPFSVKIENNNFFDTGYYNLDQYFKSVEQNKKTSSWIHLTKFNNKPMTTEKISDFEGFQFIKVNDTKKSGMIRDDFDTYIYNLKHE